jgi:haloacetate dehalogenase
VIEGFEEGAEDVGEAAIAYEAAGAGPPLLLLHGYPQTRTCWHRVAPALAERFTVVAADLRGYGDSSVPPDGEGHEGYSKRAMAADMVELMARLGHERFALAGHDRGGRVAHRLVRDHPARVSRVAVLDIVPTKMLFDTADAAFATSYYHWFFLIQPDGLPETMIGRDPEWFLRETVRRWSGTATPLDEAAIGEYVRWFSRPEAIHASCEDYRAGASIDLEHDAADAGRRVACPLLALWGEEGRMNKLYDVLGSWRDVADDVRGRAVPGGHFVPEEAPEETVRELTAFFDENAAMADDGGCA